MAADEAELSCSLTTGEGGDESSATFSVRSAVNTAVVCRKAWAACSGCGSAAGVVSPGSTTVQEVTVSDSAGRWFERRLLSLTASALGVSPVAPRLMSADHFFVTGLDGAQRAD